MEVIENGKVCACNQCGCIMKYNDSDIKTDPGVYGVTKLFSIQYIRCPVCNNKITIKRIYLGDIKYGKMYKKLW